jgi:intraflagellar transport protein 80
MATALGWTPANELFTCSDDKSIWKWNIDGEPLDQITTLGDTFVTDLDWFPTRRGAGTEFFVVGCTDGSFKMVMKAGRVEKNVEKAHTGAVTAVRWNYEGTSLLTAGEDGMLKIWSKNGMPRSTLLQLGISLLLVFIKRLGICIYSVAWSPNNDQILLSVGKDLVIKPLQPSSKQLQWQAHEGTVLKVDWNPVNNLIVSGGEDCKYKVTVSFIPAPLIPI